jgi:hypothetical protein
MGDLLSNLLNNEFAVYIIAALGGLFGFLISWKELAKIFRMVFTPASEIAHLQADEQVQILGQAQSMGSNILSPITKTPCVLWQFEIDEKTQVGQKHALGDGLPKLFIGPLRCLGRHRQGPPGTPA